MAAVGRPRRLPAHRRRGARQLGEAAAVERAHDPDLVVAIAVRHERDLRAVGRPGRLAVVGGVVRQPQQAAAVGVHHVDLVVAVARGVEGDLRAVGRPGGARVEGRVVGQVVERAEHRRRQRHRAVGWRADRGDADGSPFRIGIVGEQAGACRDHQRRVAVGGVRIGQRDRRFVDVGHGHREALGVDQGAVADLHAEVVNVVAAGVARGFEIRCADEAEHAGRGVDAELGGVDAAADRIGQRAADIGIGRGDAGDDAVVLSHADRRAGAAAVARDDRWVGVRGRDIGITLADADFIDEGSVRAEAIAARDRDAREAAQVHRVDRHGVGRVGARETRRRVDVERGGVVARGMHDLDDEQEILARHRRVAADAAAGRAGLAEDETAAVVAGEADRRRGAAEFEADVVGQAHPIWLDEEADPARRPVSAERGAQIARRRCRAQVARNVQLDGAVADRQQATRVAQAAGDHVDVRRAVGPVVGPAGAAATAVDVAVAAERIARLQRHRALPALLLGGADRPLRFDRTAVSFERPVATRLRSAGEVVAGGDIGAGQGREVADQRPPASVCGDIATVQQQVGVAAQRGAPWRQFARASDQGRRVEPRASDLDDTVGTVAQHMHGSDVGALRKRGADSCDAIFSGTDAHDLDRPTGARLRGQVVDQRLRVGQAHVNEGNFRGHLRGDRHAVFDTFVIGGRGIGHRRQHPRRDIGRIKNSRFEGLEHQAFVAARTHAHPATFRVRGGIGSARAGSTTSLPPGSSTRQRAPPGNLLPGLGSFRRTRKVLLAASIIGSM